MIIANSRPKCLLKECWLPLAEVKKFVCLKLQSKPDSLALFTLILGRDGVLTILFEFYRFICRV